MSRFEPGLYMFRPVDAPEGEYVALETAHPPIPPDLPVKVIRSPQRWFVKDSASANGTFNVFTGVGLPTDRKWIDKFDALYASLSPPVDFTITSAGEGVWNIGIANEDRLLTYDGSAIPQLTFRPADGSSAQHFQAPL